MIYNIGGCYMLDLTEVIYYIHSASFSSPFSSSYLVWELIKLWSQVLDRVSVACRVLSFHFQLYACIPQES